MTMDCRSARPSAPRLRSVTQPLPLLLGLLAGSLSLASDQPAAATAGVVAIVGGNSITHQELVDAASEDLDKLDGERLQLEVRYATTRHRLLEQALSRVTETKLLQAEAARRHVSIKQLLETEVNGKAREVTPQQLDSFYQLNHVIIGKPEAEVADELRTRLAQENRAEAKVRFLDQLRRQYGVENRLGPLRLPVGTTGPARGAAQAPVTLVEFADFECPYCTTLAPLLRQAVASWPDELRVVFRQYPLEQTHSHAWLAAEAALCAGEQQRFWEMHDALYADPTHLEKDQLTLKARKLGLDMPAFGRCLDSDRYTAQINRDMREGNALGVQGTPSLFINGSRAGGLSSLAEIRAAIDSELGTRRREFVSAATRVPERSGLSGAKGVGQY